MLTNFRKLGIAIVVLSVLLVLFVLIKLKKSNAVIPILLCIAAIIIITGGTIITAGKDQSADLAEKNIFAARNIDLVNKKDISFINNTEKLISRESYTDILDSMVSIFTNSVSNKVSDYYSYITDPSYEPQTKSLTIKSTPLRRRKECLWDYNKIYNELTDENFFYSKVKNKSLGDDFNSGSNFNDEITCSINFDKAIWVNDSKEKKNKCLCRKGWAGCSCEFELYDKKYLPMISADKIADFDYNVISVKYTDNVSYNDKLKKNDPEYVKPCSLLCDNNDKCSGFILENDTTKKYKCTLLKGGVVAKLITGAESKLTSLDMKMITGVYLKKKLIGEEKNRIIYKDRILIGSGNQLLRPTSIESYSKNFVNLDHVFFDKVVYLNYNPSFLINDTGPEDGSSVDYGEKKEVIISSLPIIQEDISNKAKFKNSSTMVIIRKKGFFSPLLIPAEWAFIYCLVTDL